MHKQSLEKNYCTCFRHDDSNFAPVKQSDKRNQCLVLLSYRVISIIM